MSANIFSARIPATAGGAEGGVDGPFPAATSSHAVSQRDMRLQQRRKSREEAASTSSTATLDEPRTVSEAVRDAVYEEKRKRFLQRRESAGAGNSNNWVASVPFLNERGEQAGGGEEVPPQFDGEQDARSSDPSYKMQFFQPESDPSPGVLTKKQEYAAQLKVQIAEKEELQRNELSRPPPQPDANEIDGHNPEYERRRKQQEYAALLRQDMEAKWMSESSAPSQKGRSPVHSPADAGPNPESERRRKQMEYAALLRQDMERQKNDQLSQDRASNLRIPSMSDSAEGTIHDRRRKQSEYAELLRQDMAARKEDNQLLTSAAPPQQMSRTSEIGGAEVDKRQKQLEYAEQLRRDMAIGKSDPFSRAAARGTPRATVSSIGQEDSSENQRRQRQNEYAELLRQDMAVGKWDPVGKPLPGFSSEQSHTATSGRRASGYDEQGRVPPRPQANVDQKGLYPDQSTMAHSSSANSFASQGSHGYSQKVRNMHNPVDPTEAEMERLRRAEYRRELEAQIAAKAQAKAPFGGARLPPAPQQQIPHHQPQPPTRGYPQVYPGMGNQHSASQSQLMVPQEEMIQSYQARLEMEAQVGPAYVPEGYELGPLGNLVRREIHAGNRSQQRAYHEHTAASAMGARSYPTPSSYPSYADPHLPPQAFVPQPNPTFVAHSRQAPAYGGGDEMTLAQGGGTTMIGSVLASDDESRKRAEKEKQRKMAQDLQAQIDADVRRKEGAKRAAEEEDKRENERLQKERDEMQREFEVEEAKKKKKEEEQARQDREMARAAAERRKKAEENDQAEANRLEEQRLAKEQRELSIKYDAELARERAQAHPINDVAAQISAGAVSHINPSAEDPRGMQSKIPPQDALIPLAPHQPPLREARNVPQMLQPPRHEVAQSAKGEYPLASQEDVGRAGQRDEQRDETIMNLQQQLRVQKEATEELRKRTFAQEETFKDDAITALQQQLQAQKEATEQLSEHVRRQDVMLQTSQKAAAVANSPPATSRDYPDVLSFQGPRQAGVSTSQRQPTRHGLWRIPSPALSASESEENSPQRSAASCGRLKSPQEHSARRVTYSPRIPGSRGDAELPARNSFNGGILELDSRASSQARRLCITRAESPTHLSNISPPSWLSRCSSAADEGFGTLPPTARSIQGHTKFIYPDGSVRTLETNGNSSSSRLQPWNERKSDVPRLELHDTVRGRNLESRSRLATAGLSRVSSARSVASSHSARDVSARPSTSDSIDTEALRHRAEERLKRLDGGRATSQSPMQGPERLAPQTGSSKVLCSPRLASDRDFLYLSRSRSAHSPGGSSDTRQSDHSLTGETRWAEALVKGGY